MGLMNGAGTVGASVNFLETEAQQSDDKSLMDRIEEELRRRRSGRPERDPVPGGLPPWLMQLTPDVSTRMQPMRFDARRGPMQATDSAEPSSAKQASDDTGRGERRRRDDNAITDLRRAAKSAIDTREAPTVASGQGGETSTGRHAIAAPMANRMGQAPLDEGMAARVDALQPSSAPAVDASGAAQAMQRDDTRKPSQRGDADAGTSGASMLAGAQGHASAPHRPLQGAPVPHGAYPQARSHGEGGGTGPSSGGDRMRYAFGTWGAGRFVNVQVLQMEGGKRFVLGASDAIVQRRLSAALSGTPEGTALRGGRGISEGAVEAIAQLGDTPDEESEC